MEWKVVYARSVVDFMATRIETRHAYERVDSYRKILAAFPYAGEEYDPYYESASPSAPCRSISVPGTPFTLYYGLDESARVVNVFSIEHQRIDPLRRFSTSE
ncbi:MAG: hypothetical protein KHY83_02375 [Coriobacteriia bacterium]|nr:hypothetical protein [Coriobacteriia bacterium]MBS5477497.1 hypothetical protein [Coriobacteriia bacterium]